MEDKKRLSIIILSIVSAILLVGTIVFFTKFNESKKESETIAKEMEEEKKKMNNDMDSLIKLGNKELLNNLNVAHAQYNELLAKIDNDSLKFKLERERDRTQTLIEELERQKATSAAEIMRLNKELETLRAILKDYTRQIAELSDENKSLKIENTAYKEKVENANRQIDALAEQKEQLTEKVAIASQLEARNVKVSLLKKNSKGTEKIKSAKQIKLSFTIAKNVTSSTGDKTVYARIFQPDMEVLVKSEANRFPYENKEIQYSIKKSFEYTGEETSIDMYWNIEETLQKGEYTVYFFVDGNMIGEGKGTFK